MPAVNGTATLNGRRNPSPPARTGGKPLGTEPNGRFTRRTKLLLLLPILVVIVCAFQVGRGMLELQYVGRGMFRAGVQQQQALDVGVINQSEPRASRWHARLSWQAALHMLRKSHGRYVVVDAKNGLGNRLRAMASARAVAHALGRPMLLVWQPDLHCNCSFRDMFEPSDPMVTLLEEEIPQANMSSAEFQKYNYMRPEPGAIKDEYVRVNPSLHLYFKSAFIMNHPVGKWNHAQRHLQTLVPVPAVARMLVADRSMVGLHVRNVFDAPRDDRTSTHTVGSAAIEGATVEYGAEGARQLLAWRKASHWSNFVSRITSLMREHDYRQVSSASGSLRFYLAADSAEAYEGLQKKFPSRMLFTPRTCADQRCDFRDCRGMIYSLVDMMNLARTKFILGSGWSSYSEVAAYMGGDGFGEPLPILMAGRDFGEIVDRTKGGQGGSDVSASSWNKDDAASDAAENAVRKAQFFGSLRQYWPKPFDTDSAAADIG